MKRSLMAFVFVGLAIIVGIAWAQSAPQLINYQGRLTDSSGQPPVDGTTVDLTFSFYGVASGATPLYLTVLQEDVVVNGGIYNVMIGSGTITPGAESALADVFQNHTDVWMGVEVDADGEMIERSRVGSVPYALGSDNGIPKGGIIMWSGAITDIPAGWQLCDGTNGTPDLRDRFIMGAPSGQDPGQTGGSDSLQLTTSNLPAHAHNITVLTSGPHEHRFWEYWKTINYATFWIGGAVPTTLAFSDDLYWIYNSTDDYEGEHNHTATASNTGGDVPFDNRPAYYTLAFIMKM